MADFSDLEFKPRKYLDGVRAVRAFPNGYSASVVRGSGTYGSDEGLYELGVMHSDRLVYDTPITDDVLGYLSEQGVTDTLNAIEALPARDAVSA